MKTVKRIDSRDFDDMLPVHVDIDQINEQNKTCKYICGNVNHEVYNKNTNNNLTKLLGGDYVYAWATDVCGNKFGDRNPGGSKICDKGKRVLLGNGSSSVVACTLIGPVLNNLMFSKGVESTQFNIRIKNVQGYRNEREKIYEEIVTKNCEQVIDSSVYKFQQFHFKIQILHECSYILPSIINAIILTFIYNNISLNYVINAVSIGIVDVNMYNSYIEEKESISTFPLGENKYTNGNYMQDGYKDETSFSNELKEKFFYHYNNRYIPKIIIDPLNEEIDTYCSSAFCFIVAPDFNKILSNILIKNSLGVSGEVFHLSKSYACQASKCFHENVKRRYSTHLEQVEACLENNYL
ncbi:conserved Plasmodium protein, unknown function [Plasmodium ovale]|uniref:Uncharacterized protein n=2 Tax=Plasmodium ovale TaxID=36330 RepID=A0A1A8VQ78_PLAOA|nr:conserved Plasmodium protein, unknown function [Plasmodium ovale curtisi]SBS80954.1 conserved Plasmodium protein, unknown function [Plasmodium ovale curtisi]SCA48414.1 conserved Plasmodium protein, unknown function [Plasmodium ovale]